MSLNLKNEVWRKSVHLSGVFFLPILFWSRGFFVFLLILFLISYLIVEVLAKKGKRVPLLTTLTEKSKRPYEKTHIAKGPIYLVIAGILCPYLFGIVPTAIGLTQIFVADVTSTFAGVSFGKRKLPYSKKKSWIGSSTFFLSAFAVTLPFVPWPKALLLALVGTIVESLPIPEADNLTVPLSVSLVSSWII